MKIYCLGDSLTEGDYGDIGYQVMAKFIFNTIKDRL